MDVGMRGSARPVRIPTVIELAETRREYEYGARTEQGHPTRLAHVAPSSNAQSET